MSDNFNKPEWWGATAEFLSAHATVKGRLRHSYVEMVGESGHHMFDILSKRGLLPSPEYFVGMDLNPGYIFQHMLEKRPFRLVHGNFFTQSLVEIDRADISAANFNYDGTAQVGSRLWWQHDGTSLRELVRRSVAKHGYANMILNMTLQRMMSSKDDYRDRLKLHTGDLCRVFCLQSFNTFKEIMGTEGHGAYQVYRSALPHVLEMATIRIKFVKSGPPIVFGRCKY